MHFKKNDKIDSYIIKGNTYFLTSSLFCAII